MTTRLINDYPEDLQGIISDYLVGEKQDFKHRYNMTVHSLKLLITELDNKKYISFMEKFIERDRDPSIPWSKKLEYRQECQDFLYKNCLMPAPLSIIFERIEDWSDSYREFHCN